jgi:lipopolysaccharide biosynthesis protein
MRRLLRPIPRVYRNILIFLQYPLAILGSCIAAFAPRVRAIVQCADPSASSSRYAVYASYDRNGSVPDYVVDQVAALNALGYRVIFVSTSPRLSDERTSELRVLCWKLIHRYNLGHDFGSYKCGISEIGSFEGVRNLILMNDSCYGPLFDLSDIERQVQTGEADIVGITESWQHRYHLQSYFLNMNGRVVRSPSFRRFWATLLPYQSRELTIRHGEVRFTQLMVRSGFTTAALCPYRSVARFAQKLIAARVNDEPSGLLPNEKHYLEALAKQISQGVPLNPTHSFWDVIIVEFGCPFIKRELLKKNPKKIPGVSDWPAVLSAHTGYDINRIEQHLKVG